MTPLCQGDHPDRSYSRLESWAPRSSGQALSTEQPCLRIPSGLNSGLITKPAPVAVTADSWGDRRVRRLRTIANRSHGTPGVVTRWLVLRNGLP